MKVFGILSLGIGNRSRNLYKAEKNSDHFPGIKLLPQLRLMRQSIRLYIRSGVTGLIVLSHVSLLKNRTEHRSEKIINSCRGIDYPG